MAGSWLCPGCKALWLRADESECWACHAAKPKRPTIFNRDRMKLAATGFVQVVFVAGNTIFITSHALLANFLTAWAISWIWTFNVKKVAFGDSTDRWFYAIGAALGSVAGNIIATALVS